jgi:molecular chaperone DnaK (HSP70)
MNCASCGYIKSKFLDVYCPACGLTLRKVEVTPDGPVSAYLPPRGTGECSCEVRCVGTEAVEVQVKTEGAFSLLEPTETTNQLRKLSPNLPPVTIRLKIAADALAGNIGVCKLLHQPQQAINVPIVCEPAPDFRVVAISQKLQIVPEQAEEGSLYEISELGGEDAGPRHSFRFELRGTHAVRPLSVSSFDAQCTPSTVELVPDGDFPVSLLPGRTIPFTVSILSSAVKSGQERFRAELSLKADGVKLWSHKLVLEIRPVPRIEIARTDDWGAFVARGIVRGIGATYEARVPLINRGGAPCRVVSVDCDSKAVEVLTTKELQLPAFDKTASDATQEHVRVKFRPDDYPGEAGVIKPVFKLNYVTDNERHDRGQTLLTASIKLTDAEPLNGAVCVDFGTTNTCVAVHCSEGLGEVNEDETMKVDVGNGVIIKVWLVPIRASEDADRGDSRFNFQEFPTMMSFRSHRLVSQGKWEKGLRFGHLVRELRNSRLRQLLATAAFFKSQLWQENKQWPLDEESNDIAPYDAEQLTELFFKGLTSFIQRSLGRRITQLYLTHPAAGVFHGRAKDRLVRAAAQGSGLPEGKVACSLTEPAAFAFWQLFELKATLGPSEERVLGILDIGGGTTDITVLKAWKEGGDLVYRILYSGGVGVGGEEMTYQLTKKTIEEALRSKAVDDRVKQAYAGFRLPEKLGQAQHAMATWRSEWRDTFGTNWTNAERFKTREYATASLEKDPKPLEHVVIVRDLDSGSNVRAKLKLPRGVVDGFFRRDLEQIFGQLRTQLKTLAEEGDIPGAMLDQLILAGNGSRLALVREMASKEFPGENRVVQHTGRAKMGVAFGAALHYLYTTGGARDIRLDESHASELQFGIGIRHGFGFRTLMQRGASTTDSVSKPVNLSVARIQPILTLYEDITPGNQDVGAKRELTTIELEQLWADPRDSSDKDLELVLVAQEQELLLRLTVRQRKGNPVELTVCCARFEDGEWNTANLA